MGRYEELESLPGAELVLRGIDDLANGQTMTPPALLVAMARSKLRWLDLDIPAIADTIQEPELTLYDLLAQSLAEPYGEYKALRYRLNKFENALENLRVFEGKFKSSLA